MLNIRLHLKVLPSTYKRVNRRRFSLLTLLRLSFLRLLVLKHYITLYSLHHPITLIPIMFSFTSIVAVAAVALFSLAPASAVPTGNNTLLARQTYSGDGAFPYLSSLSRDIAVLTRVQVPTTPPDLARVA